MTYWVVLGYIDNTVACATICTEKELPKIRKRMIDRYGLWGWGASPVDCHKVEIREVK